MLRLPSSRALALTALLAVSVALGACSGTSTPSPSAAVSTSATGTVVAAGGLTLVDGWMRSKEVLPPTATGMATDMTMTGIFGMLTNATDKDITVTGGSSPVAGMVELHETVPGDGGAMVMRPKAGGFVVPAHGTFELKPGGNHIMLMKMASMPKIGTAVEVTLQTSIGVVKFTGIPARNFAGGDEKYVPGTGMPSMSPGMPSTSH